MDLNENIKNNIQRLRKKRNITQEVLADALEISVQAVSKWETGISLPDIMLLPRIAQFFGVTIDYLFYNSDNLDSLGVKELPNDDIIRIVQFKGNKLLDIDKWEKGKDIMLKIPDDLSNNMNSKNLNFEIWGNGSISGNISGYVECKGSINSCNIGGYAESESSINCANIGGYAESGGGINCGNIGGYAESGGSINCGNINGYVECGGDINCGDIMSNVECGGDIRCNDIKGNVQCDGDIIYENNTDNRVRKKLRK